MTNEKLAEDLEFNFVEGWTYNETDGYYYYNNMLTQTEGGVAKTLSFDKVTVPATWGNETADASFKIIASVEAIQADFLKEDVLVKTDGKISGWNISADDIKEYTAQ